MDNQKTISGGSDGSAGFITGGTGASGEKLSPNPANQSETVQDLLSSQKAQELIKSAMHGAVQAIMEELKSSSNGGKSATNRISDSNAKLGTDMTQVDNNLQPANFNSGAQPPSPTEIPGAPIPALNVVNDVPQQTVLDNTTVKQIEADSSNPKDPAYEAALEPANIPLSVPNYHKPEGPSTKICKTCKYFNKKTSTTGDCFAYGFTAIGDYTCDSWNVKVPATNGVDSDRTRDIQNPIGQPTPIGIPPKYQQIDFYPNKPMADNANAAIQARDSKIGEQRGITPYAETCARCIIQSQPLMPEMWRRIYSYYYEHQKDPNSNDWENHGPAWQQWMAWGGDEGFEKAKQIINAMNQADEDEATDLINSTDSKSIRSVGKKKFKKIEQASAPTSVTPGGEIIDDNFEAIPGSEGGLNSPNQYSNEITPELSLNHGRGGKSAVGAFYLPGERVYSKSSFSLGEVIRSEMISNQYIYNIKLINVDGLVHGTAVVHEADLTPRSVRAIKRMEIKAIRESVESYVKQVIDSLEKLQEEHADPQVNPLTSSQVQSAEKNVQDILANETFADASSKMGMRKYVRAMQDVEHSLGAAVHILKSAEDLATSSGSTKDADMIAGYGQKNTLFRINQCVERAKECLLDEVPMRTFTVKGE